MIDRALMVRLEGYGLTTAEIHYYRPDAPSLLNLFVWQDYDLAPDFPVLFDFIDYWNRGIEGALHSIRIVHDQLVRPAEWRAARGDFRLG
ncbi:usg protein [Sphingomonas sanxanigenens]|uniref:Protein usg n=1 Tax=Sphingomonas sanxanigenens DSM 19645 = NX02 TaxID=1123269 RepID=W0A8I8_9SPHN|nr:usg protein [Sphingomonas sanxanigenens]AHE52802.1 protein usg [Sphingomonas sanxanigenens DSM 19645 = NX02]